MNKSTNDGLVMIEIPCEECINGSVERIGATMPVACLHCDGAGRVELYGDDALDELERREVAKLRAAERRGIQAPTTYPDSRLNPEERREIERRSEVAQLAAGGRSGSLARPARRDGEIIAGSIGCFRGWSAHVRGHEERYMPAWGETESVAVAELIASIECIDDGGETAEDVKAGVAEACARFGLVNPFAEPADAPARAAWPFDNALEASRDKRARRTNAHHATVAAFERLAANPGRARQTSVGGWAK